MSSESENFEQVRQLLALKRHEVPPPGYFNGFSREVMARIKAGERGQEHTWWERLHSFFEIKPAFAGAFGAAVCLILVAGVLNSEETGVSSPVFGSTVQGVAGFDQETALARPNVSGQPVLVGTSNSATVLREMFDHIQPQTQPVSFGFTPGQ